MAQMQLPAFRRCLEMHSLALRSIVHVPRWPTDRPTDLLAAQCRPSAAAENHGSRYRLKFARGVCNISSPTSTVRIVYLRMLTTYFSQIPGRHQSAEAAKWANMTRQMRCAAPVKQLWIKHEFTDNKCCCVYAAGPVSVVSKFGMFWAEFLSSTWRSNFLARVRGLLRNAQRSDKTLRMIIWTPLIVWFCVKWSLQSR